MGLFTVLQQGLEPGRERRPAVVVETGSLPSHATFISRRCISRGRIEMATQFRPYCGQQRQGPFIDEHHRIKNFVKIGRLGGSTQAARFARSSRVSWILITPQILGKAKDGLHAKHNR